MFPQIPVSKIKHTPQYDQGTSFIIFTESICGINTVLIIKRSKDVLAINVCKQSKFNYVKTVDIPLCTLHSTGQT